MRDWTRYAEALDMRLGGATQREIAEHFGVSKQRAAQMIKLAQAQLAYRVFRGVPRPLPKPTWLMAPLPGTPLSDIPVSLEDQPALTAA